MQQYPVKEVTSSDELIKIFKTEHGSPEAMQEHLKKGRNLWFFTRSESAIDKTATCAIETLAAH
jgi:hypothetical protein